jgi:hypothetical protein
LRKLVRVAIVSCGRRPPEIPHGIPIALVVVLKGGGKCWTRERWSKKAIEG